MGRLPIDQAMAKGRLPTRDAVWAALRRHGVGYSFTLADMLDEVKRPKDTVRDYLRSLVGGKYLAVVASIPKQYQFIRDTGVEAPRLRPDGTPVIMGAACEQMWRTMKFMGNFTALDLSVEASLPDSPVSEVHAKDYAKDLAKAGYLAVVSKGKAGKPGSPSVFRFIASRNTGPLPPMIQRVKTVYDPNLRQVVYTSEPRT